MPSPYAVHQRVENDYLVRERDRRRLRELLVVAVAVVALGGGLLVYTWVHIQIVHTGYRVEQLEKRLHNVLEQERRRRLEASHLSHPRRVAERAAEELGMLPPTLEQTLYAEELVP